MKSKSALKRKIVNLLDTAIQGGISETRRTCGNKRCFCHRDSSRKHGPNLYLTFKTADGRSSGIYIPRTYERVVRKKVAAWGELWNNLVTYVAINRAELRHAIAERQEIGIRYKKKR